MDQTTITIIFGIITLICMITMFILYINIRYKISKSLEIDKLKVKDIEIDKNLNINPDILIKGDYNLNNFNERLKNNKKIQLFYIKNDDDESKIPMEFHLNELLYLIYTIYKYQFMEKKEDKPINNYKTTINNEEIPEKDHAEKPSYKQKEKTFEEQTEENTEEQKENNTKEDTEDKFDFEEQKENFKNINGYDKYYYY